MTEVSVFRLYLMRAMYLLMAVGLGSYIWPAIMSHELSWPLMKGIVSTLLGAMAVLVVFGIRHPLQMFIPTALAQNVKTDPTRGNEAP